MRVKCSDGIVRDFTIRRWRSGIFGCNYVTCDSCNTRWESAKCTTVKDMREIVQGHVCETGGIER